MNTRLPCSKRFPLPPAVLRHRWPVVDRQLPVVTVTQSPGTENANENTETTEPVAQKQTEMTDTPQSAPGTATDIANCKETLHNSDSCRQDFLRNEMPTSREASC